MRCLENMNKKKTIILLIIGILVVTTLSLGVTYSYMKNKTSGNNETEIGINNCAKITLKDNDNTLNLTNMYPMEEEMGLQTTPYEFTISSTCEEYTGFNLYLTTLNDNEIKDKDIRYAIADVDDNVLITDLLINKEEATDLSEEEIKELEQGLDNRRNKTYKVYNGVIPLNKDKVYKLHLWIDENANNDTMNQSFKIKVSIKGYKYVGTLAEYLIKTKDRSLIYHNELPDYKGMENYELEAGDLSYRFTGGNDIVNNYVCLDGTTEKDTCASENDLYRIIGLFQNEEGNYEAKLIKATYATTNMLGNNDYNNNAYDKNDTYFWNSSKGANSNENTNSWRLSNLNTINLNKIYYMNLINKIPILDEIIINHKWFIGGRIGNMIYSAPNANELYNNEIGNNKLNYNSKECYDETKVNRTCLEEDLYYPYQGYDEKLNTKIGLMYASDYGYATYSKGWSITISTSKENAQNNWLEQNDIEWTITRNSGFWDRSYALGKGMIYSMDVFSSNYVRPTFYLDTITRLKLGNGTADNPYRITI